VIATLLQKEGAISREDAVLRKGKQGSFKWTFISEDEESKSCTG
jgi:hypothetical protein